MKLNRGMKKIRTILIKKVGRLPLAAIMIIFCCMSLHAQEASENQKTHQFWLDYNPSYKLSDRLDLKGSFGARTVSPNTWYRLWARPYLSYKRPKFILKKLKYNERLDGGIDIFYTVNKDNVNRLELTPFQAYSLAWPDRERLVIRHYLKLEERFELETDDWNNTFGLRLSYEAGVTFKFHGEIWKYGKGFYIPVSAKFFWNLIGTKQFNDKVRITPGIGYQASPEWKVAFLLGYNYSRNDVNEEFHTNDIIYRLRVYHTIKRKMEEVK
jgi:hypothetical protein